MKIFSPLGILCYLVLSVPLFSIGGVWGDPAKEYPIVYTSQPIDTRPWDASGTMSTQQPASEVIRIAQGFGETDLELKAVDGSVKVLYNCTAAPVVCAAQEPRVNPAGDKVAFSVSFGDAVDPASQLVNEWFFAKLYIYDVNTGAISEIPNQDNTAHNRTPDWINNTTLVYMSNKGVLNKATGKYEAVYPVKDQWNCHQGTYPDGRKRGFNNGECVSQYYGSGQASRSMQIWRMNIDGTDQRNLTPHEYNAIRPFVARAAVNQGRIYYSTAQMSEDEAYYQGSPSAGTTPNLWWIKSMDQNGADERVFWGAHHSGYINKESPDPNVYQKVTQILAVRVFTDDLAGNIYGVSYYRGNHGGLGDAFRASTKDVTVEGCSTQACYKKSFYPQNTQPGSGQFIPADLEMIAPFAVGSDNEQTVDAQGRPTGKFGGEFLLANGHIGGTWGKGWCYNQLSDRGIKPLECDKNIVEFLVPRVIDPFDPAQVKVLAGDPKKHETDAVQVSPHKMPEQTPPLDKSKGCFLDVVNLTTAELDPIDPVFHWNMRATLTAVQANTVNPHKPQIFPSRVKQLSIYGVKNWGVESRAPEFYKSINYNGYQDVWLLGRQPMMDDRSLRVRVPCEKTILLSASDADGRDIAHDAMPTSLRKGETRTCFGCHEGHSLERARLHTGKTAEGVFAKTKAAATNPPLLNGRMHVTFPEVAPIITKACSGCHEGFQNDALLWSRVFADAEQLDFPWMKKMQNANGTNVLPRPYFSGLVARYADWSMLVWVMQGKRSDGFANEEFADDQDYPKGHPAVPLTANEIKKVVDYIQLGAPMP